MRYQPQFLNTSSNWEHQNLYNKIPVFGLGSSPLPLRFPSTSAERGRIFMQISTRNPIHTKQKDPAYKGQKEVTIIFISIKYTFNINTHIYTCTLF